MTNAAPGESRSSSIVEEEGAPVLTPVTTTHARQSSLVNPFITPFDDEHRVQIDYPTGMGRAEEHGDESVRACDLDRDGRMKNKRYTAFCGHNLLMNYYYTTSQANFCLVLPHCRSTCIPPHPRLHCCIITQLVHILPISYASGHGGDL